MQINKTKAVQPTYQLATVDVWDTLLRRRCHPDAVKLHVCRYLLNQYGHSLSGDYKNHWKLLRARQLAEKTLADISRENGFDDEYLHLEVYQRWLELIQFDNQGNSAEFREQLPAMLERIELDQERYVTYPDPLIMETIASFDALQVIFLSDFYLPARHVQELLRAHGLAERVVAGVVSCEVKLNKKSGRLFQHIHKTHGIRPEEHVHVGDNQWADVDSPRRLGIQTVHYAPASLHKKRIALEAGFHDRQGFLRNAIRNLLADPSHRAASEGTPAGFFYDLGRRSSLLLFTYILYIMEHAVADKVEKLFFFTREGEFFLQLYQRVQEQNALGHPVPNAVLLEVSRISTFAGSLREFSCTELMRIWNQYSTQSLAALFSSLDIKPASFQKKMQSYDLDLQESIRYPWLDQRVQSLFADIEFRDAIETLLQEKKCALLSYLASKDLPGNHAVVGIVDIGWRGTIQDNLAYVLPGIKLQGYYFALNRFLNTQPDNCTKSAFGPNLNTDSSPVDFLLDYVAPIEMLCNSPNGSVQSYRLTESGVRVLKLMDASENQIHEAYIRYFQQGVLDSMAYWADFSRTHAYPAAELRPSALQIWGELIQNPHPFLAKAFFELNHNEIFGTGTFADKKQLPNLSTILMSFISPQHRAMLRNFMTEVGWLPGLLANPEISTALRVTIHAHIKKSRMKAAALRKLQAIRRR